MNPARPSLKARIRAGETLTACFVFLPSPAIVEILALAGLDFIIIDLEHAPKDWESVENMLRAAKVHQLPALVRIPEIRAHWILHALEAGAQGIVLPFVESAADVRRALDAMLYGPLGRRGSCTQTRAAAYGSLRANFPEHASRQNEELVLMGLIESPEGLRQTADLLDMSPGLDLISVGRSDLAAEMGLPGRASDPRVHEATVQVLSATAARAAGGPRSAMVVYGPQEIPTWGPHGCTVWISPSESGLLLDAASAWSRSMRETARTAAAPAASR